MRNGAIALRNHLPPIGMVEPEIQIFNSLASVYDVCFEQKGRLIFTLEVDEVNHIEMPRQIFSSDAGFTVILAGKGLI